MLLLVCAAVYSQVQSAAAAETAAAPITTVTASASANGRVLARNANAEKGAVNARLETRVASNDKRIIADAGDAEAVGARCDAEEAGHKERRSRKRCF